MNQWCKSTTNLVKLVVLLHHWFIPYKVERDLSNVGQAKMVKLVVLLHHWFIPYKVDGEKRSFQCGTSKNCLGVHEFP